PFSGVRRAVDRRCPARGSARRLEHHSPMTEFSTIEVLETLRRAEKEQTLTYRSLAARAEAAGDGELAQRFHDLHADEQHHFSRITARILELGGQPVDLADVRPDVAAADGNLDGWAQEIRAREQYEVDRYRDAL